MFLSMYVLAVDPTPAAEAGVQLNDIIGGGAGATLVGLGYFIIKLILDRTIPSRSDARAGVTMLLDGLNKMVEVLRQERAEDAKRLQEKQARIDFLEKESDLDFGRLNEMREDIIDLRARLALKEAHIAQLVLELRKLGATVEGMEDARLTVAYATEVTPPARPDTTQAN
jgi:hypothetical protein